MPPRPRTLEQQRQIALAAAKAGNAPQAKLDERSGLPAYPKTTANTEATLRNVQKQLATQADRVTLALAQTLAEFEQAFAAEERTNATQARIAAITAQRTQRRR